MLPQYFNCNERLEIFLTYFGNILCYVGGVKNQEEKKFVEGNCRG